MWVCQKSESKTINYERLDWSIPVLGLERSISSCSFVCLFVCNSKHKRCGPVMIKSVQFCVTSFLPFFRQCSECDQASSDEADIAMETLPDGTKRSRRQIKGPIKFIPQEMSPEPKKHQVRGTVCIYTLRIVCLCNLYECWLNDLYWSHQVLF